jgi:Spy/CpxP family protein refolding chaperone
MKTTIKMGMIAFAISCAAYYSAQAQAGDVPHHNGGYGPPDSCHIQLMVDDMAKQLTLTDQQRQQILEIHYKQMQEVKALPAKYKNDCVGEREARNQLRQQIHTEVRAVLNKDQQVKFDKSMKERCGRHDMHHGRMHNPQPED